ncbi:AIR synthase family protein [Thermoproteota archaeon]
MSPKKLLAGKIPKEMLTKYIFTCLGVNSDRLLKGPLIGEDAAVIDMGERVLVAKANPITGAENRIGWLAVHINANDVAARGAKPLWYLSIILLPNNADESLLETIMQEQHEACIELGICIVGGHTEVVPDLGRPIVSGFMLGEARKDGYITTGGARVGDHIILTKGVGIEGTGILAVDLRDKLLGKVTEKTLDDAVKLFDMISVVPEAKLAISVGGVNSMHTPTEGGVLNGLLEVSEASGYGFKIYEDRLMIHEETRLICDELAVDPLRLLSSGSLLIVAEPAKSSELVKVLSENNIAANVIGEIVPENCEVVMVDGSINLIDAVDQDELFRVLEEIT